MEDRALECLQGVRRLNFGCGSITPVGWINSDLQAGPGVDISADVLKGLPLPDDHVDYISSQHVLCELGIYDQVPALTELRRVLKPGGVLRLCLPDFEKNMAAFQTGNSNQFYIWEWDTIDGNFITHVLWYGCNRTLFTWRFLEELLRKAGFADVRRVAFRQTSSAHPEIVDLDDREAESLYVEAVK